MRKIERKAAELLTAAAANQIPVDVERIAKHLKLVIHEEKDFEEDLSGVLLRPKEGRAVIAVNARDSEVRRRFSIAHELGHYYLGHSGEVFVDKVVLNRRDVRSTYAIDPQEIEANAFAAALLMPAETLMEQVLSFVESHNDITQEKLIADLAKRFRVSQQAMNYRLMNLGLLTAVDDTPSRR